ncbi:uncharacterized protein LOC123717912 isoform X1 [Pieris brassicae]|uniref:uncharacterized protein LOC123717912 isoform X1 n=2 Tax=Pieris brassicae TaxID=7116 RepID=UPI001E65E86D|nr:uncharacterized protein LOC123717912 isoform X1 [Pieris brassicae]
MECPERDTFKPKKDLSLSSLILWNIKKVMEINTSVNLKDAMQSAYQHLEEGSYDVNMLMAQGPEEQHLACAILAWQRLGHGRVDSLINFIHREKRSREMKSTKVSFKSRDSQEGGCSKNIMGPAVIGPVVRLPVETKIVMHMENPCARHQPKKKPQKDIISKIEPCCMDSACIKRLTDLDAATGELRKRAARLAKREAERVELLERAEAAWRDLEVGFQRRLTLAEEKEDDLAKEIKKLIEDRNDYKNATNVLIKQLKERSKVVEKEREQLTEIEKEVCNRACERLRLSEQATQGDAAMAELHCRSTQLERELLYKEEQARRKVIALENEKDSIRGLTLEAERAMRSELSALKEQMMDVSKQLLVEEARNNKVKAELEEMRQEKMNIIEDLEGCKDMCDGRIQKRVDVLKTRRDELNELKNRVIECECKLPQDAAVEVKRTPSLAALCYCQPEDRALDACSCMSLRSQLLSNLLSDLFSGLQSELGGTRSEMPCQLLKCLEDRHNWDRGSLVKTNLRNFFAQLLLGELDIAIATSIEKYHAKWVGASCNDHLRAVSGHDEDDGWQDRAIERRAQKLATKLAEQLFRERADLMAQKAKDIMNAGPPPCECKPQQNAAVYPCLVKTQHPTGRKIDGTSSYLKKTIQDVTNIKSQIEDLKKESIKKEDLRQMEDKLARIIQRVTKQDSKKGTLNSNKIDKKISNDETTNKVNILKSTLVEPLQTRKSNRFQSNISGRVEKYSNKMNLKKKDPSVAVNLCLCDPNKTKETYAPNKSKSSWDPNFFTELTTQISNVKLSKPIVTLPKSSKANSDKKRRKKVCPSKCVCLHKIPSNKSIDKLLDALKNWKFKLDDPTFDKAMETNGIKRSPFDISYGNRQTKDSNNVNNNPIDDRNNIQKLDYLPLSTLSEYMGAVNLDKSDENVCKCSPDVTNTSDNNPLRNFKCISANLCACKEVDKEKPHEKKSQIYTVNVTDQTFESSIKEAGIQKDSFIDKIVKDSELFSYDCEYDIKFLGATLTDNRCTTHEMKSKIELVPDNTNLNRTSNKDKCSRSDTYDNLRRLFDNDIKCDKVERLSNISKPTKESCICCNDSEQQNDLECNTFNLLEDYLRDRLNQFKTSCKSSCIQPKDEEKLYSTVLNKVKDFISINMDKVSCKCLKPCEGDDRWTRVYGLLQEYLNMKIQRVQCTCPEREEPSALPNVLDEVINLINNDFKKLKDLCVCERKRPNDEPATKTSVRFSEKETFQTPVKKEMSSFTTNVDVLNTSCSPIPSIDSRVNVEMVEKVTSCKLNDLYITDCKCRNAFTEPYFLGVAVNEETEIPSLSNVDLKSSTTSKGVYSNIELKQPYIGYTLNCSCDNHLGCVCTKSLVQTNDDKINLIWNSFSKVYPEKLSYIMRAVPLIKSEHNSFGKDFLSYTTQELKDDEYFDIKESECQTQTSNEDEIALKKSADVINKSNNDTNTEVKGKESSSSHQSFVTVPNDEELLTNKNTLYNSLFLPVDNLGSIKSYSSSKSDDCECNMVPICHVKLLVENIEYNLKNSNCICDAMSSQVCPIHKSVKVN